MNKVTVIVALEMLVQQLQMSLAHRDFIKEIVPVDIKNEMAQGKALDTCQQAQ